MKVHSRFLRKNSGLWGLWYTAKHKHCSFPKLQTVSLSLPSFCKLKLPIWWWSQLQMPYFFSLYPVSVIVPCDLILTFPNSVWKYNSSLPAFIENEYQMALCICLGRIKWMFGTDKTNFLLFQMYIASDSAIVLGQINWKWRHRRQKDLSDSWIYLPIPYLG